MWLPILAIYLIIAMLFGRASAIRDTEDNPTWLYWVSGIIWLPYLIWVNITGKA